MSLKLNIDAAGIASQFKEFQKELEQDLQKGVALLAASTDAQIKQMASEELNSTREQFMESLGFEEVSPGVWVISVDEKGLFVEDGIPANTDMKPALLAENFKTSKSGNKYKVIPFDYGKAPSKMTSQTKQTVDFLRKELKKENVPFKKIEKNPDGTPKTGKLHEFNFGNPSGKMGGPGQGSTPMLKGLSIYQTITATGNVRRDILTFRTVSSGPASSGKFIHPGLEAKKFLDRAMEESMKLWDDKILPEILAKYK